MFAGHAAEFEGSGVNVNVVAPGDPTDAPMIPEEAGFDHGALIPPSAMAPPIPWLCSEARGVYTGHRYVAAQRDISAEAADAARSCRALIGWPGLGPEPGLAQRQAGELSWVIIAASCRRMANRARKANQRCPNRGRRR